MRDFIIVSCAFGKRYLQQLTRLEASITQLYHDMPFLTFREEKIPGKPFYDSLYGFKPHAINKAIARGYKKVIFLDPACILQHPVDYWLSEGMPPVIAVKDDNLLSNMISDKALDYYGNPDISDWHLVGGSLYVFDFNQPAAVEIMKHWYVAELDGMFGSQAEQSAGLINRHRNDESCMAVAMYSHGVEPIGHDVARYNQDSNSIIIKKHFK